MSAATRPWPGTAPASQMPCPGRRLEGDERLPQLPPGTKFSLRHFRSVSLQFCADKARGTKMQEYCAYIIGPDGHIVTRIDLTCADEDEAKERAVRLVDGQ